MHFPSIKTEPSDSSSKPAITRKVVVFPHPLGPPKRDTNSPFSTFKETFFTAANSPNFFVIPFNSTSINMVF